MEPKHTIEYEMTSEMATDIQRGLLRLEMRRGWRRDIPLFVGALLFGIVIGWLVLEGWVLPAVAGGLLCLPTLAILGAVYRRRWLSYAASMTALIPLHSPERRVRIEFHDQRVRMETEFFRGEGAWTELDEIVTFPTFWVLYLSNGGQIVIPGTKLTQELKDFLHAKAEQVTAPIIAG